MNGRKLWEKIASGSRNIRFDDFVKVIEAFGFQHRRTAGSHRIYSHPRVLQPRGGQAKPHQITQFLGIVEEFGSSLGDE